MSLLQTFMELWINRIMYFLETLVILETAHLAHLVNHSSFFYLMLALLLEYYALATFRRTLNFFYVQNIVNQALYWWSLFIIYFFLLTFKNTQIFYHEFTLFSIQRWQVFDSVLNMFLFFINISFWVVPDILDVIFSLNLLDFGQILFHILVIHIKNFLRFNK